MQGQRGQRKRIRRAEMKMRRRAETRRYHLEVGLAHQG
jgi:hypothetical protein